MAESKMLPLCDCQSFLIWRWLQAFSRVQCYNNQYNYDFFEYFMGPCATSNVRHRTTHNFDSCPLETQTLKGKNLPKLQFHGMLSHVILKQYPYAQTSFTLGESQTLTLDIRERINQDTVKWKIQDKFGFQMTEYELRKNFLEVTIRNENKKIVGKVSINLFLITTGPFHQDFELVFANGKIGRISFDLKISQIISVTIKSIFADIFLLKDHPGQDFCYSIKTIASYNGSTNESQFSYPAVVLLEKRTSQHQKQDSDIIRDIQFTKRKSQRLLTKEIEMGHNLTWSEDGGILPLLQTKVLASQLHNTYFQVIIWKEREVDGIAKRQFFADSYVSFYKLFGTQSENFERENIEYESRSINMTEKIQHYGKDYGKGSFSFQIINEPYFRQYHTCVHTELGILKTAPIFVIQQGKNTELCSQLQQLITISQKVQQNIIILNNLLSNEGSIFSIKRTKFLVEQDLEKIFNLLQKTFLPPSFIYRYTSQQQLMKGQKILVELGLKITKYIQIQDPVINDIGWLILISLIKRGQFTLSHMGFQEKQKRCIEKGVIDEKISEKIKTANIYKMLIYKLLSLALKALIRKGSQYQKTFAEIFSAYAYFRIPEFRKQILRLITHEDDPEISQWRGIQFNLHDDLPQSIIKDHANIFSQLFDWEQHFFKWLPKDEQLQSEDISLGDTLAQEQWKDRFRKRGLAFFYFLKYWVTYIQTSLPNKKDIQWRYFPGYNRLLKGFFVEMKQRSILTYPDALIQACLKLLVNEKVVNPVMKIMLNKVSIHDTSAVLRVLEHLSLIFKSITAKNKQLHVSFNYGFFFKALKVIFQSQFSMGISSALSLIYNHFTLFHIQFRRNLSMYFLGRIFFKLFLNWSHPVRNVFYHLITYKIYSSAHYFMQKSKQSKFSIADSDILARYDQLFKIMSYQQNVYNKLRIQNLENNLDKNYFKKMKFKILQRVKKNELDNSGIYPNTKAGSEVKNDSDSGSLQNIKIQTNSVMQSSRRILFITEKMHSSEIALPSRVNIQNKENLKDLRQTRKIKNYDCYPDDSNQQFVIFHKIIHEKQFQIGPVGRDKAKSICLYLSQFKQIEGKYLKALEKQDLQCPVIKISMSIDNREIRPEKIDQW